MLQVDVIMRRQEDGGFVFVGEAEAEGRRGKESVCSLKRFSVFSELWNQGAECEGVTAIDVTAAE